MTSYQNKPNVDYDSKSVEKVSAKEGKWYSKQGNNGRKFTEDQTA